MNAAGGIILFDCLKHYFDILPKGDIITEKEKAQFEEKIIDKWSKIHPVLKD